MTGLKFTRLFSTETADPSRYLDAYDWEWADITLPGETSPTHVEFPSSWSIRARRIVAQKYFRMVPGPDGERVRETSFRQVIDRVATTIMRGGLEHGYYASEEDARIHRDEIAALVVGQFMAFNSPVWFNVGVVENPQVSACFLTPIQDSMESIQQHYVTEGRIYSSGSGSGTNYSRLRGSMEPTSSGGTSSGPCAFIAAHDAAGGSIKSGGSHRRSAKMVILDADHPDIIEFIRLKSRAEDAASALISAGFKSDFRSSDGAYALVPNQNANHSVRVTDEFMRQAVEKPGAKEWALTNRLDGSVAEWVSAADVLREMAAAAHRCGDPGMQFHDSIQRWHTAAAVDQIWTANPCCFVGDTIVETLDGKIPISELATMYECGESLPFAVAWEERSDEPVLRQIKRAWKSGETTRLVRVTTDRGVVLTCTPEHPFLLRDGGWIDAKNLETGARLRTIHPIIDLDDRVVSCEIVETQNPTPVYDIEVDGVHNFSVSTTDTAHSIVVHNSEFVFLDNTSCNLADFNVLKFFGLGAMEVIGYDGFKHAVRTTTVSMDILVEIGGYPTEEIDRMTRATRPLGLGITNLGCLLMSCGLPYDSDKARGLTSEIVSTMSAAGWWASAEMVEALGGYELFDRCRDDHLSVMQAHSRAAHEYQLESRFLWMDAISAGLRHGYRNAQMSVMAPSGTRSFMLDCDTTGIEPAFALQTVKLLVGGGSITTTLGCVRTGLRTLGYDDDVVEDILDRLATDGVLPIGDGLGTAHADVFRVAVPPPGGGEPIHWRGHIDMMAAIQPFISGAQSKTVSLPNSATVEDVMGVYTAAWRAGLKAISVYRDGCKSSQPLSSTGGVEPPPSVETESDGPQWGDRLRPERTRRSITTKFVVGGNKGYLTVGLYPDGAPCEIFVRMAKEGSTISGLLDSWATAVSLAIQHGAPLEAVIDKMIGRRFEPSGWTGEEAIPYAASVPDYIARWLRDRFVTSESDTVESVTPTAPSNPARRAAMGDGPECPDCHVPTVRNGTCHACPECGRTTGCAG